MLKILFDDKGTRVDPALKARQYRVKLAENKFNFCKFMVVNAGWIEVSHSGQAVTVALRPAKVSGLALGAALYHLCDVPARFGTLILYEGGQAENHQFSSRTALVAAICKAANEGTGTDDRRFARRSADNQRLRPEIASVVDAWSELQGTLDMERLWRLLNVGFSGRYIVAAERSDGFHLDSMGNGFSELANYWRTSELAPRISDQPDVAYGRWVTSAYADTVARKAPLVEMVDCDIAWPQEGTRRHCYWRVIAPFRRSIDGGDLLLSVTLPDASIALRNGSDVARR